MIERRKSILTTIDVVERPEEKLPLGRAQQLVAIPAVGKAEVLGGSIGNFVAKIAVDSTRGHPFEVTEVAVERSRRGMAGVAHAHPIRMIVAQAPADVRPAIPVGAFEKIQEAAVGGRAGVTAGRPFLINLAVTIATVVMPAGIGRWIDPFVTFVILGRQSLEVEDNGSERGNRPTRDEIPFFANGQMSLVPKRSRDLEQSLGVREDRKRLSFHSNPSARHRIITVEYLALN
jgi:hypothetical protein